METEKCTNCGCSHLFPPLTGLPKDADCPFVPGNPCVCCGEPVTELSMGDDRICGYCDAGRCLRRSNTPQCGAHNRAYKRFYERFYGSVTSASTPSSAVA